MKDTGMNRKVDVLGRIVIPAEIRKSLALKEGDQLDISLDEGRIVLSPTKDSCALCGARVGLLPVGQKSVCVGCRGVVIGMPEAPPAHLRAAQ